MTDADTRRPAEAEISGLGDTQSSRRYFAKFAQITQHLGRVAGVLEAEGTLTREEVAVTARYVAGLRYTFRALGLKYLLTGRETGRFFGSLAVDRVESGFPVFAELLTMANDAAQAGRHLEGMPSEAELKDEMVRVIIRERQHPTKLQFALSQRLYYEDLLRGELFWARNDPQAVWLGNRPSKHKGRDDVRRYLLHWAVYDSEINLPTIYLMDCEDSGRAALPRDQRRWPEAQAHLMAQSLGALKLLTIARGFDEDFPDLHPKRLRRLHVGPMYSQAFTRQTGPLREVLAEAAAPDGEDWALAWTLEELQSERVEEVRSGWFSTVERQVFALDPFSGRGVDTGATRTERAVILPQRPYQVLAEKNPPGFRGVRKFVVGAGDRVMEF